MTLALKEYSQRIVSSLSALLNLNITVEELPVEKEEKYYSFLHKEAIKDGETIAVLRGTIYLNYSKLTENNKIRQAIAHEMAHLVPHTTSFSEAWKLWRIIVSKVSRMVEER